MAEALPTWGWAKAADEDSGNPTDQPLGGTRTAWCGEGPLGAGGGEELAGWGGQVSVEARSLRDGSGKMVEALVPLPL